DAGEQAAKLLLLLLGAHARDRRGRKARAADGERDAGAAVRELLRAHDGEPRLALRLVRIALLVDAGQLLATVDDRGLREAEALRGLHQVPRHRLFLVVLDRDRPDRLLRERAEHLAHALEHRFVVEEVHQATALPASTRPSRSSP